MCLQAQAWLVWLIASRVRHFSIDNHFLQLLPVDLFRIEASNFLLLSLCVFQHEDASEEVEEEESTDEDEDDEENGLARAVFVLGSIVTPRNIDRLVHDVRPAF